MTKEEIKKLEEITYAIGWSGFPIDALFNDIRDNDNPRFNKDLAYQDFKKIIDEIYLLIDKAKKFDEKETPKKVTRKFEVTYIPKSGKTVTLEVNCPKCEKRFYIVFDNEYKHCPHCGQHLEKGYGDDK